MEDRRGGMSCHLSLCSCRHSADQHPARCSAQSICSQIWGVVSFLLLSKHHVENNRNKARLRREAAETFQDQVEAA